MRMIELSDHPGDQLRKIQQERQVAEEQARSGCQRALARHGRVLAELRQRRDTARARHRWRAWLRGAVAAGRALDPPQLSRIESLIVRDHQFHQARRDRPR